MNKTKFKMKSDDKTNNDWKKGEEGYIDGYVFNGKRPYCMVVLNDRLIMCMLYEFKVLKSMECEDE